MIKHMKLGDMPQFCETVKAWLNERYGEEQGAAIWRATAAQHPAAFHTVTEPYDWENRAARYSSSRRRWGGGCLNTALRTMACGS